MPHKPKQVESRAHLNSEYVKWCDSIKDIKSFGFIKMRDCFRFDVLKNVFSWAEFIRAGIILVHRKSGDLLMIHEKPITITDKNGTRDIPVRKGFPKGISMNDDVSAVDTALRELNEETGIDIRNCGRISSTIYVIPRPDLGELFIYFVCVVDKKPSVVINDELVGYEWTSIKDIRGCLMTKPTQKIVHALENMNLRSINNLITID